jgi:hypothetical protein
MTGVGDELMSRMDDLATAALTLLPSLYDPRAAVFCHKVVPVGTHYRNEGENELYSAIALAGLAIDAGPRASTLVASVDDNGGIDRLVRSAETTQSAGLLGMVIWALSEMEDPRAAKLLARVGAIQPRVPTSMDLGLLLAGASSAALKFSDHRDYCLSVGEGLQEELCGRFVRSGALFRGVSTPRADILHWHIASFATQVYPILGTAMYGQAAERVPAWQGRAAADQLIETQGPAGQWWWMYSPSSGRVLEGYPVYVVHQSAMAFMALVSLQQLGAGNFRDALQRGLMWLEPQHNELGSAMYALDPPFFSRAIQRRGSNADAFGGMSHLRHARLVAASLTRRSWGADLRPHPSRLEILREDRPYHLGWLLLARALTRRL